MNRKRWEDMTFWERDRRIGRGLAIAWSLIGLSALLLYASIVWSVIR